LTRCRILTKAESKRQRKNKVAAAAGTNDSTPPHHKPEHASDEDAPLPTARMTSTAEKSMVKSNTPTGRAGQVSRVPQPNNHAAARDVSNDQNLKVDSCLGVPPAVNLSEIAPSGFPLGFCRR